MSVNKAGSSMNATLPDLPQTGGIKRYEMQTRTFQNNASVENRAKNLNEGVLSESQIELETEDGLQAKVNAKVEGQWQGSAYQLANFSPSRVQFDLNQSYQQMQFEQQVQIDPQTQASTQNAKATWNFIDGQGQPQGQMSYRIEHKPDETQHATDVNYQFNAETHVEAHWGQSNQGQNTGFKVTRSDQFNPEQPVQITSQAEVIQAPGNKQQNLNIKGETQTFNASLEHNKTLTGTETVNETNKEAIGLGWKATENTELSYHQERQVISQFLNESPAEEHKNEQLTLTYQSESTQASLNWQRDTLLSDSSLLPTSTRSLNAQLGYVLNPSQKLGFSYQQDATSDRKLGLNYSWNSPVEEGEIPAYELSLGIEQFHPVTGPVYSESKVGFLARDVFDQPGMELRMNTSYSSLSHETQRDLYLQASRGNWPLDLRLEMFPDGKTRGSLNVTGEF